MQSQIDRRLAEGYKYSRKEYLAALRELTERVDGYQSADELDDDELILVFYRQCRNENRGDVGDECRSRVHEHTDEYRCHGVRYEVDAELVVEYHQRRQNRENDNHHIEHCDVARLDEIVLAEECKVEGEEHDKNGDDDNLSDEGTRYLVASGVVLSQSLLIAVEHPHLVGVDDGSVVDDALALLDESASRGDGVQEVALLGFVAVFIVDEVCLDVFVEVARLQKGAVRTEPRVHEQAFVGIDGGEHAVRRHCLSLLADDDTQRCFALAFEL